MVCLVDLTEWVAGIRNYEFMIRYSDFVCGATPHVCGASLTLPSFVCCSGVFASLPGM